MREDEPQQAETFNQDQQEMFQNPDATLGDTRPRTPGAQNLPPAPATDGDVASKDDESGSSDSSG
ncbi:MAG TPA: hypothetical protein VJT82_10630 [Pyrinomonadaceae bacterium]|nr:hypothetical protein [Pyrinomonadaceae bacterium]